MSDSNDCPHGEFEDECGFCEAEALKKQVAKLSGEVADRNVTIKELADRMQRLEHQLAVEKGRPGHDSYRDDLLRVVCAMLSTFDPRADWAPENVALAAGVVVDKVYAEAAKRR